MPGEGFKKGHPYYPPGGGHASGRPLSPKNRLKFAFNAAEGRLPAILKVLDDIAKGKALVCPSCGHRIKHAKPDVNACIYLVNKLTGLPVAKHELSLAQQIELSADDCRYLTETARQAVIDSHEVPSIEGEFKELIEKETSRDAGNAHRSDAEQPGVAEHSLASQGDTPTPPTTPVGEALLLEEGRNKAGENPHHPPGGGFGEEGVSSE